MGLWGWLTKSWGWGDHRSRRADKHRIAQLERDASSGDARAHRQLGDAYARLGRTADAKQQFETAGRLHLKASHRPRALAMLTKAADLDRNDWRLRAWIGDLLAESDRKREASLTYREVAALAAAQGLPVEAEVFQSRAEELLAVRRPAVRRPATKTRPRGRSDIIIEPAVEHPPLIEAQVLLPKANSIPTKELALDAEALLLSQAGAASEAVTTSCTPMEIEQIRRRATPSIIRDLNLEPA